VGQAYPYRFPVACEEEWQRWRQRYDKTRNGVLRPFRDRAIWQTILGSPSTGRCRSDRRRLWRARSAGSCGRWPVRLPRVPGAGRPRTFGITGISGRVAVHNPRWSSTSAWRGDQAHYQDLIALRNALAHGNQQQLDQLRSRGVLDTVSWARGRLPGLGRTARALDRVVWDHLGSAFGRNPW
jgi:hypothetical protein